MILKIQGSKPKDASSDELGWCNWWVYDNLVKVHYKYQARFGDAYGEQQYPDIMIPKCHGASISNDCEGIKIITRDNRDREMTFWIETNAYLCNDNGKTIEKLAI